MKLETELILLLLLIGVTVGASSIIPEYEKKISFPDRRFISARKYGQPWNGFAYGLCTDAATGISSDVNCTLFVEKPVLNNEATIKFCEIGYSRDDEELKRNSRSVNGFYLNWMSLHYLNDNKLVLEMPMNESHKRISTIYTFVDMDNCKTVNRYYSAQDNTEENYVPMYYHDVMKLALYESDRCGNLRNCTIEIDFDGNEKTPVYFPIEITYKELTQPNMSFKEVMAPTTSDKGFFLYDEKQQSIDAVNRKLSHVDTKGQEKVIITPEMFLKFVKNQVLSLSHKLFGICMNFIDDSSNNNVTTYNCLQYDDEGKQKLNATFEIGQNASFSSMYNLPNGGLLAFTENCDAKEKSKCDNGFDIRKINKDGIEEGQVTVTGMRVHRYMDILLNDDQICMFAIFALPPFTQFLDKSAELRSKCIKIEPFLKFE